MQYSGGGDYTCSIRGVIISSIQGGLYMQYSRGDYTSIRGVIYMQYSRGDYTCSDFLCIGCLGCDYRSCSIQGVIICSIQGVLYMQFQGVINMQYSGGPIIHAVFDYTCSIQG